MPNKEEKLMVACKNCDLEKVKSLVEANEYGINMLEKAKSIAQEVSCPEVVDYLENINRGNDIIEDCRNALNCVNPDGIMGFGSHDIKCKDNPSNITIYSKNKKTKEGQHLEYKKDDIEKEN